MLLTYSVHMLKNWLFNISNLQYVPKIMMCNMHTGDTLHIYVCVYTYIYTYIRTLEMGEIENFIYDYCEVRISRLSRLLFSLYFY